jgi:hypothetical protein
MRILAAKNREEVAQTLTGAVRVVKPALLREAAASVGCLDKPEEELARAGYRTSGKDRTVQVDGDSAPGSWALIACNDLTCDASRVVTRPHCMQK